MYRLTILYACLIFNAQIIPVHSKYDILKNTVLSDKWKTIIVPWTKCKQDMFFKTILASLLNFIHFFLWLVLT